jgi:hypothetical protein
MIRDFAFAGVKGRKLIEINFYAMSLLTGQAFKINIKFNAAGSLERFDNSLTMKSASCYGLLTERSFRFKVYLQLCM